ncbi:MAG: DUF456 family protein [Chloroflexi bacterium]|nr:DUF456 family protein [Chloroflexota bacterium]
MDAMWWVAIVLMAVGVVGTLVPAWPGIGLVFAGALLYAIATGFTDIGVGHVLVYGALTLVAVGLDIVANVLGARLFGASKWGVLGALVGVVVGLIVGGPVGLLLGPLVGAVALEALSGHSLRQALRSGTGAAIGFVLGTAVELALALAIVISFLHATWM